MHSQQPPQRPWQETSAQHPPRHPYLQRRPPAKKSRGPVIAVVGVIVGIIALGGLFKLLDGDQNEPAVHTQPTQAARAESGIPAPDEQQTTTLLAALAEIDPALDHQRSISRARDTCQNLLAGEDRNTVVDKARQRFDGTARVSEADARKIVELVESGGWCR